MRVVVGADPLGAPLGANVERWLRQHGHDVVPAEGTGTGTQDYPDVAERIARLVVTGAADRAVLVCGTGIGMAISANKVPGCYAAVCHDLYSTQRSVLSNDANVMCLGALVIGEAAALALLEVWLGLQFVDGRSTPKVAKIRALEARRPCA